MIGMILFTVFTLEFSGKIGTDLWLSYWSSQEYKINIKILFFNVSLKCCK